MKNILAGLLLIASFNTYAKVKVVTSTPDLAWVVKQIGKEYVQVESLLTGHEDPHFADALPLFVHRAAAADMVTFIGLDLEIGWLPKVLIKTGRKDLQSGGKGHCDASREVKAIDIVTEKIDRSHGHVHASGNPHYHLSVDAMVSVANAITSCLSAIDNTHAEAFESNKKLVISSLHKTKEKVKGIMGSFNKELRALEYHKEFSYFFNEYGIKNLGSLEVVPGSVPSAGQLAQVVVKAREDKANLVFATPNAPDKILSRFSEQTKIKVLRLPLGIIWERGTELPDNAYDELLVGMAENIKSAFSQN
jgi:zinc/manganese transport system substrate-binding protein